MALNKDLERRIKKCGFTEFSLTKELANILERKISSSTIYYLVRRTRYPQSKDIADALCFVLDTFPEYIFQEIKNLYEKKKVSISCSNPSNPYEEIENKDLLKKALKLLSKQEKFAVLRYYGVIEKSDNEKWTLDTIGKEMGKVFHGESSHIAGKAFTRERVRQIISNGLIKMKGFCQKQ